LRVALADELAPSLGAGRRRVQMTVPAGGRARATTTITPGRRGRFDIAEVVVRVEGPLGLAARQERRLLPGTIRVQPRLRSRQEADLRVERARLMVGLRTAAGRGGGREFDALREYTPDDEPRRIDWAATARSGRAIVRTYRAERNQSVVVLLDCGRTMAAQVDGVPRFEHALDALLTLTAVASGVGDRVGLVAFDREVRAVVQPSASPRQLAAVTEAVYALEPELVESDYRGAFAGTLARFRRRALLVILTELAEQAMTDTVLPALPLIARDHVVVVAAVRDPEVELWAEAAPEDASGAYRKAAAVAALEERRRVALRLRRMGVTVVDAPPRSLPGELADAYLDVKAQGTL
jgi:uncharacterized protein (DUF58 family)